MNMSTSVLQRKTRPSCDSRHKLAASARKSRFWVTSQMEFSAQIVLEADIFRRDRLLRALYRPVKSLSGFCTFGQVMPDFCTLGHFMRVLATCDFISCASNHLLRGQDMPFLRPFNAVSHTSIL